MENDPFFREYTSQDAILKYTRGTAGYGISYLLDNDYKRVYLDAIQMLPAEMRRQGLRVLEFGCGGGMNLVHLISVFNQERISVECAVGTDFSPVLIDAARREAKNYLPQADQGKVEFHVAKNETLIEELASSLRKSPPELQNSFQFILGVNTFRYCHRAQKELDCAKDIFDLLMPGGVCVMIDMNNRFPVFRSAVKNRLRGQKENEEECYLPTLTEYTSPFATAGFEVLRSENFCWVPHSAGPFLTGVLRCASPFLNLFVKSRAMRSLVISRKPVNIPAAKSNVVAR
jgi:SAM-dependent methyltransferase